MKQEKYDFDGVQLTLRQMVIISMLVRKYPRKLIAKNLGISVNTLNSQMTVLYAKTGCICNLDLILKALENGFDRQGNYLGDALTE